MNILVLNCGSSSLKFQVFSVKSPREPGRPPTSIKGSRGARQTPALSGAGPSSLSCVLSGVVERIGSQALVTLAPVGAPQVRRTTPLKSHRQALDYVFRSLSAGELKIKGLATLGDIHAVGHRVVHGGEHFRSSVLIDSQVIKGIEDCIDLAPLHNPANLNGIASVSELLGGNVPQVAVFDTAFHSTMPECSYLYAIPYQYYRRHRLRRYGFHGTSFRSVLGRYCESLRLQVDKANVIILHLGNGCSACAVEDGKSKETSMGLTPMEGLVMGTRCGDIDPAILEVIAHKEAMSLAEIDSLLNKQSGLLGLSGLTNDMRELIAEREESGDRRASLAIDIFCHRARQYVGAYFASLKRVDALIFTAGIGENSSHVRAQICEGLGPMGFVLDNELNNAAFSRSARAGSEYVCKISSSKSPRAIYVIRTNEESLIAEDTLRLVGSEPRAGTQKVRE